MAKRYDHVVVAAGNNRSMPRSWAFRSVLFERADWSRERPLPAGSTFCRQIQPCSRAAQDICCNGRITVESITCPGSATECAEMDETDVLFSTLYAELHLLAKRQLARNWQPASLSVTTLLHETYLDMAASDGPVFPDRARFMGYAARVMRGLIIDHARKHRALKHGGEFKIT